MTVVVGLVLIGTKSKSKKSTRPVEFSPVTVVPFGLTLRVSSVKADPSESRKRHFFREKQHQTQT